ncbi:unnamed protein product, partial [Phaeothamnion confervicola]
RGCSDGSRGDVAGGSEASDAGSTMKVQVFLHGRHEGNLLNGCGWRRLGERVASEMGLPWWRTGTEGFKISRERESSRSRCLQGTWSWRAFLHRRSYCRNLRAGELGEWRLVAFRSPSAGAVSAAASSVG